MVVDGDVVVVVGPATTMLLLCSSSSSHRINLSAASQAGKIKEQPIPDDDENEM